MFKNIHGNFSLKFSFVTQTLTMLYMFYLLFLLLSVFSRLFVFSFFFTVGSQTFVDPLNCLLPFLWMQFGKSDRDYDHRTCRIDRPIWSKLKWLTKLRSIIKTILQLAIECGKLNLSVRFFCFLSSSSSVVFLFSFYYGTFHAFLSCKFNLFALFVFVFFPVFFSISSFVYKCISVYPLHG